MKKTNTKVTWTPRKKTKILGCSVVGGIGMLLNQGVPGFEAWFGVRPVVDAEIEALVVE